jgi:predicted NBD/HSP70 family sugar kinase
MGCSVGVLATHYIWVGIIKGTALERVRMYPEPGGAQVDLKSVPVDEIITRILDEIDVVRENEAVDCVGAGFPGIVCNGVIDDSPNLGQLKGLHVQDLLFAAFRSRGMEPRVAIMNDADALATGIAATRGRTDRLIRVWYLGDGIGFGRHPHGTGVWEGGHSVVTLDPKERFCGCGGTGHLEGIMGNRAMRLRFLDMEPEEVFIAARQGDTRAGDFVKMWHRALAAATATSVHMSGPGRFYICGPNADYVDLGLLNMYMQDMVKMSPLQGTFFEIVPTSHDLALIGAALTAAK